MASSSSLIPVDMSITSNKAADESKGGVKWIKKPLFFTILCCLTTSIVIVLSMSPGKEETGSCNGEARVLYRHRNVTRSEIHDLVSLFSDSDQVNNLNWLWLEIVLFESFI